MALNGSIAGPTEGIVGPLPAGEDTGLPTGGTTGQPLVKLSNADFDAGWQTLTVAGGGTGAVSLATGGVLVGNGTSPVTSSPTPTLGVSGSILGTLSLAGNTSGLVLITPQAAAGTPTLTLPNTSGTFAASAAAPITLSATTGQIGLTTAALTKTDDTNVTLTLGGSPTTALVAATSLTLGWTGTLAPTRGGTGIGSYTLGDVVYASAANTLASLAGNITSTKQYLSQTGTGTVSAAPAWATISGSDITGAALTKVDDTNVTLTLGGTPATSLLRASSITAGWTGQLSVSRGGTGLASLTAHNLIIGNGTSNPNLLAPSATSGVPLISQGSAADPVYGTALVAGGGTGLTSGTSGGVLGFTASGTLASSVALTANGVVLGGGAGATPTSTSAGTNGQVLMGVTSSAPTFQTMTAAINFVIDGGGTAITTGVKGYLLIPFACTVATWTALADQSGSITIDVYNDSYANYGTNTSMVGAGTKPNIATATKGQSAPASWTSTSIAAGSIVGFNVTAATTVTRVTIELTVNRTSA